MRARLLIVLVTLAGLIPLTLSAQTHGNGPAGPPSSPGSGPGRSSHPLQPRSSAPPSHPLPVPFAGTVPDPFIQPAPSSSRMQPSTSRDVFRSGPWTYAPRYGRWSAVSGGYAGGYGAYYDAGGYYGSLPTAQAPADLPQGRLALLVTPATTQVYVDGFYLGVVADFQDRGLWLESGPRRIELRADG